ncbi:hypothetical protein LWI29_023405 [Acer saccharum]|uniref:Uncharacterized protein n=1 Tax=Acer saccharum TaxID=4024 RepID=A0AA39VIY5_ACESA|nr:hypothetical protein LWI29_023405 [Acer saccharum]
MYSLMFPLPLYFIEIKFCKSVLVSALSFFIKHFSVSARNSLALIIFSDTTPLNASRVPRFMIIRLMRFERSTSQSSSCHQKNLHPTRVEGFARGQPVDRRRNQPNSEDDSEEEEDDVGYGVAQPARRLKEHDDYRLKAELLERMSGTSGFRRNNPDSTFPNRAKGVQSAGPSNQSRSAAGEEGSSSNQTTVPANRNVPRNQNSNPHARPTPGTCYRWSYKIAMVPSKHKTVPVEVEKQSFLIVTRSDTEFAIDVNGE